MDRIDQFRWYQLGQALQRINIKNGLSTTAPEFDVRVARMYLGALLNRDLSICRKLGQRLHDHLSRLMGFPYVRDDEGNAIYSKEKLGRFMEAPQWNMLGYRIERFEVVLEEELRHAAVYNVPRRGIFDVSKLIDEADSTFPASLQNIIPDKAKQEWRSAGRCLAFNLLSASGFHVARAVEGMLEVYTAAFGIREKGRRTWGDYVAELRRLNQADPSPSDKVISEIVQMKDDWRNPLMHPRVVLDVPAARMLFANGESLLIAMASEILVLKDN